MGIVCTKEHSSIQEEPIDFYSLMRCQGKMLINICKEINEKFKHDASFSTALVVVKSDRSIIEVLLETASTDIEKNTRESFPHYIDDIYFSYKYSENKTH